MSVKMMIHFASYHQGSFILREHLCVDQDYPFMGHIVDMSLRRGDDPSIPEKPVVHSEMLQDGTWIELHFMDEKVILHPDQDLFSCKAGDFNNIPENISTTKKNLAIVNLLKALDPRTNVIIQMSW